VQDNIASALYEVSYLKARESLEGIARWEKEKQKNRVKNTKGDDRIGGRRDKMGSFIDVQLRKSLSAAVKQSSKCLSVCWCVCSDILHRIKRKKRTEKERREEFDILCTSDIIDERGDGGGDENEDRGEDEKGRRGGGGGGSHGGVCCSSVHATVSKLLAGLDERAFRPAVSFSFVPPPPPRIDR
jgi:hypothetical protein